MYKFMMIASYLIRNFYLPNPFESLGQDFAVTISGISIPVPPILLNIVAEPIIYFITFRVVSLFYEKGFAPAWGSFLYLIFYCVHIGLIMLCGAFHFAKIAIGIIIILYIALLIGIKVFENKAIRGYI